MKIIDLSLPHENFASEPYPPEIVYFDHSAGSRRLAKLAGVEPSDFPDSLGLASERVTASTHSGTHVDAPWHYGPICEGMASRTIDRIPLEWCYGPGVILDMRYKEPGSEITIEDLEKALEKISYTLKPGDIVLLQTGADKYWGTSRYVDMQSGLGVEGTAWLLERGIRCIGIDAWGLDRPVSRMGQAYKSGDKSALWPSHMYGRKREYLQIEKLANLDLVPHPIGFTVCAFPIKIANGSAGWCRAVAIIPG
ncbi:MAG: cyclase family protein [Anaerolineae bacterium]